MTCLSRGSSFCESTTKIISLSEPEYMPLAFMAVAPLPTVFIMASAISSLFSDIINAASAELPPSSTRVTIFVVTITDIIAYMVFTTPNTNIPLTIITASIRSITFSIGRLGLMNLNIAASMSVPPVVAPALSTSPTPVPTKTPPKSPYSIRSSIWAKGLGIISVSQSATESRTTAYRDFRANPNPLCLMLTAKRGMLSTAFVSHIGIPPSIVPADSF